MWNELAAVGIAFELGLSLGTLNNSLDAAERCGASFDENLPKITSADDGSEFRLKQRPNRTMALGPSRTPQNEFQYADVACIPAAERVGDVSKLAGNGSLVADKVTIFISEEVLLRSSATLFANFFETVLV